MAYWGERRIPSGRRVHDEVSACGGGSRGGLRGAAPHRRARARRRVPAARGEHLRSSGASGPGLDKVEQSLDAGAIDRGVIIEQRPLRSVPASIARAWGGVNVAADILRGGIDTPSWDEVRWQGKPGERSIWVVKSWGNVRPQQIVRVVLKGAGPVRLFQPFTVTNGNKVTVLQLPMPLMAFHESHGNVWDKFVAKNLDLRQGIGAVVGLSGNALFPDLVYLIVDQGDTPATFKAVITWRDRNIDREAPGGGTFIRIRYNH